MCFRFIRHLFPGECVTNKELLNISLLAELVCPELEVNASFYIPNGVHRHWTCRMNKNNSNLQMLLSPKSRLRRQIKATNLTLFTCQNAATVSCCNMFMNSYACIFLQKTIDGSLPYSCQVNFDWNVSFKLKMRVRTRSDYTFECCIKLFIFVVYIGKLPYNLFEDYLM